MRHAEELSTTIAPDAAIFGEMAFDEVAPAAESTTSRPVKSAVSASSTVTVVPFHGKVVPADRAEAKNRISSTGTLRSSRIARMTDPA